MALLSGCSGQQSTALPQSGVSASATAPAPPPAPMPTTALAQATGDDWVTFAHDLHRSGYQPQTFGLSKATVAGLKLRWTYVTSQATVASPLVTGGRVIVAGLGGEVYAFSTSDGTLQWTASLGAPISMTPTIADGILFVGTHQSPSTFAAINVATGAIKWKSSLPGLLRGEPAVVNGTVYQGEAGGDYPECNQGGVHAYDELTGTMKWTWNVEPLPGNGGSEWGPISYDGTGLYFGTGNNCVVAGNRTNSVVKLSTSGSPVWSSASVHPLSDDDFGSGALLYNNELFTTGKNGLLYAFDASSGQVRWAKATGGLDGYGGFGSPTTDGTTLVAPTGSFSDPTVNAVPRSQLLGLDLFGNQRWSIQTLYEIPGYAAINNGVAYVGLDSNLAAVDLATGSKLWNFSAPQVFYASPAVVPSGVYAIDEAGNLYAFSLGTPGAATIRRHL